MAAGARVPRYFARTIAAGASERLAAYGRYISIISATPATLTLQIDDDGPEQIVSGTQIDCEERKYSRLVFANTGGAPSNLVLELSDTKLTDMRGDALLAAMVASLAAIDIDTSNINTSIGTSNGHLNTINTNIADIEAAINASTIAVSTDGGFETLSIAATTAGNGADQACRECMFWTFEAHVHFKLGTTAADGTTTLLVPEVPLTIPIHNTNHLRFYNGDAAGCTVYIIWRN